MSQSACLFLFRPLLALLALATSTCLILPVHAGEVKVAVATNFVETAREIGTAFSEMTGHRAVFSFGSTGQLYAQITQGAPFEVFLAADQVRPALATRNGYAVPDSLLTFAIGRIALYSTDAALASDQMALLSGTGFRKLAIANPVTAPYGKAAIETLTALGVYDDLRYRIVQGSNIAQTHQFIETGNVELGFVALSQISAHDRGSRWIVPQGLYAPIAQDAVLLEPGQNNEAAIAFISFLKGPVARDIILRYGYDLPEVGD